MVTKQDLLDLYFTEGWLDPKDTFYNLDLGECRARYFFSVSDGMFKSNMLCFLEKDAYYDHGKGYIISSKAQLKKILKLRGL